MAELGFDPRKFGVRAPPINYYVVCDLLEKWKNVKEKNHGAIRIVYKLSLQIIIFKNIFGLLT